MWCDLLHYLNAKGFPELARGERLAMAGGVSARDRHPASGAFKRQSERCSKAATTLDLSENPGENLDAFAPLDPRSGSLVVKRQSFCLRSALAPVVSGLNSSSFR